MTAFQESSPVLVIRGLSKTFPGQRALRSVNFDLEQGSVHGLVGQNGSGKSTLIKILAGYHRPDAGATASVGGAPFELGRGDQASAAGLRFVHQDLGLAPTLNAIDNLALGRGYKRGRTGAILWKVEERAGIAELGRLGYEFDLHAPVSTLTASERTGIAIARALADRRSAAKVLVLDEPTASMPAGEVHRLYSVIRRLHDQGVATIYVSHHFGEVFDVTDTVTVLRDGAVVGTWPTGSLDEERLIEVLKANRNEPADVIVQAVIKAVTDFAAGAPQADDITLLIAKRL